MERISFDNEVPDDSVYTLSNQEQQSASDNNNSNTLGSERKAHFNQNAEQEELFEDQPYQEKEDGAPQTSFPIKTGLTTVPENSEPVVAKVVTSKKVQQQPKKTNKQRSSRLEKCPIPLESCLTRDDRNLLATGVGTGGRNTNAAKLCYNIIGTANALDKLRIEYYPNAYNLFVEFCQKCESDNEWHDKHWERIYRSSEKKNPTSTLTDEMLLNCAKAYWKKNQSTGNKKPVTSKKINSLTSIKNQLTQNQNAYTVEFEPVNLVILESLSKINFPRKEITQGKFTVYENGANFIYKKETKYFYSQNKSQWIARYDLPDTSITYKNKKGEIVIPKEKSCRYFHIDSKGKPVLGKGDNPWLPYGLLQIQTLDQDFSGQDILAVEGEKCVTQCFGLGLPAIDYKRIDRENIDLILSNFNRIIMLPDNDRTGEDHVSRLQKLSDKVVSVVLPVVGEGDDIVDYIKTLVEQNPTMNNKDIQERLVALINEQLAELPRVSFQQDDQDQESEYQEKEIKYTPELATKELIEHLTGKWIYSQSLATWYEYDGKKLTPISDQNIETEIMYFLEDLGIEYRTPVFLENVRRLLQQRIKEGIADKDNSLWNKPGYINFLNGVLDISTGELSDHSIDLRFTSLLPRDYTPVDIQDKSKADFIQIMREKVPNFFNWAMTPMGNNEMSVLKLLAVINGVLTYRFTKLHKFLYLIGRPATGKSTFLRLLEKLVGKQNSSAFTLSKLSDGNEVDSIIDKQLAVSGDVRSLPNAVCIEYLLKLTGLDPVSFRRVYGRNANGVMQGTIAMASNHPVFVGNVDGIDRRYCLVEFNNPIPAHIRNHNIEDLLETELPELTSIALAMPNELVNQFIMGIGEGDLLEFKSKQWEIKCRVDSIASWINDHLIYDIGSSEPIGTAKNESTHLYRDYLDYCEAAKMTPKQLNNFSSNLIELCQEQGWNVTKVREKTGIKIWNVRLRPSQDFETPTHLENLESNQPYTRSSPPSPPSPPLSSKGFEPTPSLHQAYTNDLKTVGKEKNLEDDSLKGEDLAYTGEDLGEDLNPLPDKGGEGGEDLDYQSGYFLSEKKIEDDLLIRLKDYLVSLESKDDLLEMIEVIKQEIGEDCWAMSIIKLQF